MDVGEEPLQSPKVNVWCAISRVGIIGPYFFDEETVTGANYLEMLSDYFHPQLVRKGIEDRIIFQQDEAPAHYSKDVREWLKWNLPGRWIER